MIQRKSVDITELRAVDQRDVAADVERVSLGHGDENVDGVANVDACESKASLARRRFSPHRSIEECVVAGEKGREQDDPRERGLSKRGAERSRGTTHQS